jgi:putative nucleotidyltransferase-like protein
VTARPARFPRENALLFAACRLGPRADGVASGQPLDWEYVRQAADRQGVAPLLHDWLTRHPEFAPPKSPADRLYHAYWANHFRNRALLSELARLADAAAGAGITFMPLKGAILAVDYYPVPALRPMSDLDLLVRPEDLEAMGHLLRSLGYREVDRQPSYVEEGRLDRRSREHQWVMARSGVSVLVEYRAEPMEPAVGQLTDLDSAFTAKLGQHAAAIWTRARPSPAGLRMSPEDLLLHVAAHQAARHADFRLIWLHDIARIVTRDSAHFDWEYVCASAMRLRVAGPVRAALEAAARWIDAPVPITALERWLNRPRHGPLRLVERWESRRLAEHVAGLGAADLTDEGPFVWRLGAAFARLHGWRPHLRGLRWAIFPSRGFLVVWHDRAAAAGRLGYATTCARRYVAALARAMVVLSRRYRRATSRIRA